MAIKKTAKKVVPAKKAVETTAKPAKEVTTTEKSVKFTDLKPAVTSEAIVAPVKKTIKPDVRSTGREDQPIVTTVADAAVKSSAADVVTGTTGQTVPVVKQISVKSMHKEKNETKQKGDIKTTPLIKPVKRTPEPIKEVKIPKTNVKTSIAYKPQYIPLEKRVDIQKSNDSIVRYNDTDLNEFRDIINKKLDTAKKELAYLQGLITRKDGLGGDESESRYVTMEDGGMSMEREQLSQMASRQIQYIDHLEKALMRIENKTYGICRVTGKLIDKARLRAVPHATLSLEAKLGLVKPTGEQ
jgi:RNA polymerase-binding transcription factor DksA